MGKRRVLLYSVIAALICLVTVWSVRWNRKDKILGDEYTCRIYNHAEYLLLSLIYGNPEDIGFNPDKFFEDYFTFEYDPSSNAYIIRTDVNGERYYLCETDDQRIVLSLSSDDYGSRWKVSRVENTMYYYITNTEDGRALEREWDTYRAETDVVDRRNLGIYMRLE